MALWDPGAEGGFGRADLQFGSLSHYFDLEPKYGMVEVLQNIYELDQVALEGYMLKHSSGLKMLDVKPGSNPGRVPECRANRCAA